MKFEKNNRKEVCVNDMQGPATRTWYGILDKYIGSKGYSVAIKKVACDQLLYAPTFIAVLLIVIGICQGKDTEGLQIKITNEYKDILMNNYKVTNFFILYELYTFPSQLITFLFQLWPMVQLVNFSLVPLHYQTLVVQSVALFWNSYISYRTSLDKCNEFK